MTNRYDNNDGRRYGDERGQRRGDSNARSRSSMSSRQRFSEHYANRSQAGEEAQGARGRLRHDEAIRDHGANPAAGYQQHNVTNFDRERYASRSRSSVQGLRTQGGQGQQQRYSDERQAGRYQNAAGQNRASGGRRQVYLDQTGQIPRYNPPAENSGSWRKQKAPRNARQAASQAQYGNLVDRYSRESSMYQARPDAASNVANAAASAQGALSTPRSFLIRIVLIVVLLLVFGVRAVLSSGPASQLADVNTQIAAQQETLDSLNAENQQMQESVDSRQSTLDAYNALVQASS